jgi:predicted MPP superfamily phosphohydrolase
LEYQRLKKAASPSPVRKQLRHFILTVVPILAVFHVYIGWQLLPSLHIGKFGLIIGIFLLVLSTALIPLSMLARHIIQPQSTADKVSFAGFLAMGFFSSLLVLTLVRSILLITMNSANMAGVTAIATLLLAMLLTFLGYLNVRRIPTVVNIDIPLKGLPLPLIGFTIVQISDLHIGATIKDRYIQAVVERVNALNADLIAITGDVVDGSVEHLELHTAPLAGLSSRHGSYLVTGNHEYYSGVTTWVKEFERLGLSVLMNEHIVIEHEGSQLVVAGVTDFSGHLFDPLHKSNPQASIAGAPNSTPKILLAHQPRSSKAAALAGFDLQLSGHTHGGQFWPWNLFVRIQQPYTAGLHRLNNLLIYISRGTGYWGPPKRLGAPSEITRLRLIPLTEKNK